MKAQTFPDRASWLSARRVLGLGGSEAAIVCGVESFDSEYAMWADKVLAERVDDEYVPEYLEAGNFLEPGIIAWWAHRTGLVAQPYALTIFTNPDFPRMFASVDALVGDDAGLDAKASSQWRQSDWDEGVPLKYQIQAQHYMAVTGRARWHFAALLGGRLGLATATVERDERFIDTLRERCASWWERHVVGREPPAPDGSDATSRAVRRMFPSEIAGETRPLAADFADIATKLLAYKVERDVLDDEIRDAENKIKAAIGDAEFGALPDGSGWKWRVEPRKEHVVKASSPRVLRYVKAKEKR